MSRSRSHKRVRFLVIDQDARYCQWLCHHLGALFPDSSVDQLGRERFDDWCAGQHERECDILLLAASFGSSPEDPQAEGLQLLRRLRQRKRAPAVIALAEQGNELTAVRALQMGAFDYVPKRLLTPERLGTAIRIALRRLERRSTRRVLNKEAEAPAELAAEADALLSAPAETPASVEPEGAAPQTRAATPTPDGVATDPASVEAGPNAPQEQDKGAADAASAAASEAHDPAPDRSVPVEPAAAEQALSSTSIRRSDTGTVPRAFPPLRRSAPHRELDSEGAFIPGYTILMTVGESEKAAVYLASSAALGHNVALKVSKTLRDETAGRQFLEREYRAVAELRHPSVVRIFDYGVHGGYEYLAMEYLPHGDLKMRIQQGVTPEAAVRYLELLASALRIVHHAGLLHRDLKPPNVMLREDDGIALIDFGLARSLDGSARSTRTGVLRGSPYYMSPEQALGEALDARSDLYSLGVMFYEMLTGRKPYSGSSAMEVLQQHVNAPMPRLPREFAQFEPLLERLLAKSPHDRFASAEELLGALARLRGSPHGALAAESAAESTAA